MMPDEIKRERNNSDSNASSSTTSESCTISESGSGQYEIPDLILTSLDHVDAKIYNSLVDIFNHDYPDSLSKGFMGVFNLIQKYNNKLQKTAAYIQGTPFVSVVSGKLVCEENSTSRPEMSHTAEKTVTKEEYNNLVNMYNKRFKLIEDGKRKLHNAINSAITSNEKLIGIRTILDDSDDASGNNTVHV